MAVVFHLPLIYNEGALFCFKTMNIRLSMEDLRSQVEEPGVRITRVELVYPRPLGPEFLHLLQTKSIVVL